MSIKAMDIEWKGVPAQYNSNCFLLEQKDCTFYSSFIKNNEVYKLGEFAVVKVEKKKVIGRLLCFYESNEHYHEHEKYRAVVRLYKKPEELDLYVADTLLRNEIVEDNEEVDIFLEDVRKKCRVIIGSEEDTLDDVIPNTYLLRYKVTHDSSLIPITSNEALQTTNCLNQFDKILTPRRGITSRFQVVSNSPSGIPYLKLPSSMKKSSKKETPHRKSAVKRNLNDSFSATPNSQDGRTPVLNYSLVESTINHEEESIKLKFRLSQNQDLVVPIEKLSDDVLNQYLHQRDEVKDDVIPEPQVRRSTRPRQRLSYAEFGSPFTTPSKRGRKKSVNLDPILITESPRSGASTPVKDITKAGNVTPSKRRQTTNGGTPKKLPRTIEPMEIDSPLKRQIKTPSKYGDYVPTPKTIPKKSILKQNGVNTPRKSVYYRDESDPDSDCSIVTPKKKRARTPRKSSVNEDFVPATPKTPHQAVVPVTPRSVKNTPSARAKLIREGLITPSVQHRATPVKGEATPLNKAKTKLHVSYVPKVLACREKEFNDVFNFVEGKLLDGCGGCMYVSGVPGTGKTATVTEVIRKLQALGKSSKIPDFEFVSINGMKLSEPRQSYVEILRQLNGKTVRWEQAQSLLDTKFTKTGHKNKPIVLLVDELDILCTKRQDVVYNLLDWPTKAKAQLIVITIANTMDLPERLLMGRVTSRLGLTRLTFQAYTHKQLQEIVTKRLVGTNAFNPDAVQLVARKVASVSGDARRALDICRRSAEIAELEGDSTMVSMKHVNDALNAMITQPKVRAIRHCTRLQQLILQAVVAEVERTGVEETTFADVYTMLVSVAALDGFQMVTCTVALGAVSRLGACRLLLTEPMANDFNQKLILNVSSDDVFYALRKD